ncbi:hypothetical protein QJS78_03450, partial [Enterococcus faecium]
MITIDTKAYLLRMFVGNFFFFLLFYMTNTDLNKRMDLSQYLGHILVETVKPFFLLLILQI